MECQINTYKVTNIISYFLLIIAYGFIMTQSIINIIYSRNKDKHIFVERLIYEQFSHEVYSNINSKLIEDIKTVPLDEECGENYEIMKVPIKIESFYDCEDVYNDDINKDVCQNKITSTSLCCRKDCC